MRSTTDRYADPLLSLQVGEFVIQERIGAGGMGVVYRASHPLIGKQVAIKVLRPELVSEQQVERLLIEARSVNAIHHPGIIDIFGFGKLPDGRPYITMELLKGVTLADLIREHGHLDVGTTVWVLDQMLAALGAAHRAGVVHRDLKPGNVFLAGAEEATRTLKLVDFGIAKILQDHDGPTTVDGAILGTPEFMSPEQIRGKPVGPATDLYAVGIMAFQMLTGARPFNGEPLQVLFAHVEQTPPLPSSMVPGIPSELDALVLHLLAKNPAQRPESAEAVRQALKRVPVSQPELTRPMERLPEVTRTLVSPAESETRTTPSLELPQLPVKAAGAPGNWRRAVVGVALLVGLGGGGFLVWSVKGRGPAALEPTPAVAMAPVPTPVVSAERAPEVVSGAKPVEAAPPRQEEVVAAPETPPLAVAEEGEEVPASPEPEDAPSSVEEPSRKGTSSAASKHSHRRKAAPAPAPEGEVGPDPALDEVHAAAVVVPPPPVEEVRPVLPRDGRQPSDARLAKRLSQLEAQYQQQAAGRDASRELARELVRLHGAAVKASTATERMDVQRGLDAWQQRLRQPVSPTSKPAVVQVAPEETLAPTAVVRDSAPPPPPSGKAGQRVKDLQQGLIHEVDAAEQWLRTHAGDVASGSTTPVELQRLRQRAQNAVTAEERTAIRNELSVWLSAWKRARGGSRTASQSP